MADRRQFSGHAALARSPLDQCLPADRGRSADPDLALGCGRDVVGTGLFGGGGVGVEVALDPSVAVAARVGWGSTPPPFPPCQPKQSARR